MDKIIYPVSQLDKYLPNTPATFYLSYTGESIIPGSIGLSFIPTVNNLQAGTVLTIDPLVGAHAFIDSIQQETAISTFSVVSSYPRFVKSRRYSNWNKNNVGLNKSDQMVNVSSDWAYFDGKSCIIFPEIELNKTTQNLNSSKFGFIKITVNFQPASSIFTCSDTNSPNLSYDITKLRLHYKTVADTNDKSPVVFGTYAYNFSNLVSDNQIIAENITSMRVTGMFGTFQNLTNAQNPLFSELAFDNPMINELRFQFNDTQALLNYSITDQSEIVLNAIAALNDNGMTAYNPTGEDVGINKGPLVFGLKLPYPIDSSQKKITTIIKSSASNTNTFGLHYYFVGFVTY